MQQLPQRTEELLNLHGFYRVGEILYGHNHSDAKITISSMEPSLAIWTTGLYAIFELRYDEYGNYLRYWLESDRKYKSCSEEDWLKNLSEILVQVTK